jgi:carbonic anhydrase/acetyltransferase-like protein (isoleucine patch superfamily)
MKKLLFFSLLAIELNAEISNLNFMQKNALEQSDISDSSIIQSKLHINNSLVSSSHIGVSSAISMTNVEDNSMVKQSNLDFMNSSITEDSKINLISSIENAHIGEASLISQNALAMDNSYLDKSTISSYAEINNIKSDASLIQQGSVLLANNAIIKNDSQIHLKSLLENANVTESVISQNELNIYDSSIDGSNMTLNSTISANKGTVNFDNATVVQGLTVLDETLLTNSKIETHSYLSDTNIEDASLETCSTYMNQAVLFNVNSKKQCFMKDSKISNGATVYHGMTRFN